MRTVCAGRAWARQSHARARGHRAAIDGGPSPTRVSRVMQKTEHEYALAFDKNPQPMWVVDRETMQFLAVNDATVRAYGYSRAELLNMTPRDLRPAHAVPVLMEAWKRFYADSPREEARPGGLWTHRRKDGTEIVVEITATDLVWAGRPAALVHALDVTERVISE